MRILYIDVNCKHSSTGQIVYSLFSKCKEHGIEAAICYGRGPLIKEPGIFKFGLDWETKWHALMTRITGYMGKYSPISTRRLIRYIKHFKPDVVHIHELHSYFVNIKTLINYLKKHNIKTVITNHCEFLYTGKCGHSGSCIGYHLNCGHCPRLKEYPKSLLFDRTKAMFMQKKQLFENWNNIELVTPSTWLKDRMLSSFFKNRELKVIHNGINTTLFNYKTPNNLRQSLNIPKDYKVVLTAAPDLFSETKGGYRFINIAKKLIQNKIICIAIGANDNDAIETFDGLKVLPLIKNKDELIEYYCLADCFVICSKHENYPTTSLEAQCCGTKVVGYDVGGVKETILQGNGAVVPFDDVDGAVQVIKDIVRETYSKEVVSNRAKEYFSEQRMFNEYLQLYK